MVEGNLLNIKQIKYSGSVGVRSFTKKLTEKFFSNKSAEGLVNFKFYFDGVGENF